MYSSVHSRLRSARASPIGKNPALALVGHRVQPMLKSVYTPRLLLDDQITCEGARAAMIRGLLYSLKEVIQPHVPVRLPCYDFTPVISHTVVSALPRVKLPTSGATYFHGVTGGVYKTRERIHRDILIRDY